MRIAVHRIQGAGSLLGVLLVAACHSSEAPVLEAGNPQTPPVIRVLSNRPDLISGGDALVEVVLPEGADAGALSMALDGRSVTGMFGLRPNGRYMGMVTGLRDGENVLEARLAGRQDAQVTIINHPIGGPVFSGPQLQPWPCLDGAIDAQCNRPVTYEYRYMPTNGSGLQAYDPANPPSDVSMTTTDQGKTVPFIVRIEHGTQDRGQYAIAVLFDPSKDWKPWAPQEGWNGKTANHGGSGCGTHHGEGAVSTEYLDRGLQALALGFLTWETQLSHNTQNCNLVVQAESLMMAKEHIVEAYGPIRYTIGNGGSGGSIKQQQAANAYPGIFDGILPAQSFTDSWGTGSGEAMDCQYLVDYFDNPTAWGAGVAWTLDQQAAVVGQPTMSICQAWINVFGFNWAFNPRSETRDGDPAHQIINTQSCNVTPEEAWDEQTNPTGARCSLADYMVSVLGRRAVDGYANRPLDNVGVQYGLNALLAGTIQPAQFIDLNAHVGSRDINYNPVAERAVADASTLATAYRGGLFNEGNHMHLPIIDMRGNDGVEIHHNYHSHEMRARLDRSNGHHDNQVIWVLGPSPNGDTAYIDKAFLVMDEWLAAIEADSSDMPYAQKVVKNKPAAAHDLCTDGSGNELPAAICDAIYPTYAKPRVIAGEPLAGDVNKCQLKPLDRADYTQPNPFTDSDWAQLQAIFPDGVCDYSKPGIGQQPTVAWVGYANGPGGQPLGDLLPPAGWSAPSFRND